MRGNNPGYLPDLLRGNTEALLLFLIEELEATYGYQLIKEIEKRSRGFFQFKEGTVYPALRKLENDGLLRGEWQEMPNGQERRYYRITPRGEEALVKKLAMWLASNPALDAYSTPRSSAWRSLSRLNLKNNIPTPNWANWAYFRKSSERAVPRPNPNWASWALLYC